MNDSRSSASSRRLSELKRERAQSMQLEARDSAALQARLAATFRTLELNCAASELDAWCVECGCIHESDLTAAEDSEEAKSIEPEVAHS